MRFIHTADWHLGRIMNGIHLTDDQGHLLNQLLHLARESKPDAMLISGDVYDRAVPPPDAVRLLDDFLSEFVLGLGIPVILIAGNHDSPTRLEFGSRILRNRGLYLFGNLQQFRDPVVLGDSFGPVHFHPLPYVEPSVLRETMGSIVDDVSRNELDFFVKRLASNLSCEIRSVPLSHTFARGGIESESERPISLGGSQPVDPNCFEGFNYVALGHLHRSQSAGKNSVRYSGSIMKYSFDEADHQKGVLLVEIDKKGDSQTEFFEIVPKRDVRCLSGYLNDLLRGPSDGKSSEDYLKITILDDGAILDVIGKLRQVYPNVLQVERPIFQPNGRVSPPLDPRKLNDSELFASFFLQITGSPLSEEEVSAYESVVDELRLQERETML